MIIIDAIRQSRGMPIEIDPNMFVVWIDVGSVAVYPIASSMKPSIAIPSADPALNINWFKP